MASDLAEAVAEIRKVGAHLEAWQSDRTRLKDLATHEDVRALDVKLEKLSDSVETLKLSNEGRKYERLQLDGHEAKIAKLRADVGEHSKEIALMCQSQALVDPKWKQEVENYMAESKGRKVYFLPLILGGGGYLVTRALEYLLRP